MTVRRAQDWIDQNETMISRRGHRIAYRRRGQGATVLVLHGFPTWSYDYRAVADDLSRDHEVVTLDFLGYGASAKPNPHRYSVFDSADVVEDLASYLGLSAVTLVVHDYGGIVGQELLDRALRGVLGFDVVGLVALNFAIVYRAYRPTRLQRVLALPLLGSLMAHLVTASRMRTSLDAVRGPKLTDEEFDALWFGISRDGGHRLAHLLIKYNAERAEHHQRWESALARWPGPIRLVWGLADPVSGQHVLELAAELLPAAVVTRLPGIGHFPQSEAPQAVAAAVRAAD